MASHGTALVSRLTLRPISVFAPGNRVGALMAQASLGTTMRVVAAPRRGTRVEAVRERFEDGLVVGEWVRAAGVPATGPAVLYLHGSAFVACSPRTHRGLVAELSAATGRPFFVVDYRLAPRHRFPAAAHDAARAHRWLLAAAPDQALAVAGDSAGAQLALTTILSARERELPAPVAALLFSPCLDLTMATALARDRKARDPFASAAGGRRILAMYSRGADPADPHLAVLGADFAGFPPTLIQTGGREMLLDDSRSLAERISAAGGECALEIWRGQIHVFPALYRLVPEARRAIEHAAEFLNRHLDPAR
ncbi:MAG: alpha/beta hydrolase [Sporichthyaceae bacterium]